MTREIIPSEAVKSKYNERRGEIDKESEEFQHLVTTIEEAGLAQNPKATMEDGNVAIIDGWHRVKAAEEAKLDKIEVSMEEEIEPLKALKTSLNGNLEEARTDVTVQERALQLKRIWEETEGEGLPSPTSIAEETGVSQANVTKWLEPLRTEWEDTAFDPTSDNLSNLTADEVDELGITKLRSIRKTTGGGEEGEELARMALDHDLTIQDLAQVRRYIEQDVSLENAVGVAAGELSEEEHIPASDTREEEAEELEEEEDEESESTTEDTSPQTSTAELSQGVSAHANGGTTTETSTETESPSTPEVEEETETEEDDETYTYKGTDVEDLVATKEEIEEMKENTSWSDDLESIEEDDDEDTQGESEFVAVFPSFTLKGDLARGAHEATHHIGEAGDLEELAYAAIRKFVDEGRFIEMSRY